MPPFFDEIMDAERVGQKCQCTTHSAWSRRKYRWGPDMLRCIVDGVTRGAEGTSLWGTPEGARQARARIPGQVRRFAVGYPEVRWGAVDLDRDDGAVPGDGSVYGEGSPRFGLSDGDGEELGLFRR